VCAVHAGNTKVPDPDPCVIVERIRPLVRDLALSKTWLEAKHSDCDPAQGHRHRRVIARFLLACSLLVWSACHPTGDANRAGKSVAPGANAGYATAEGRAKALQIFEADDRERYQKPEEIIRNMSLKAGDVVCEIGAGSGYFTPFLSKAVGREGKVYAEDPQPEFLDVLRHKKEHHNLRNVEIVLGTYTDTNLPDGGCDVIFVLDTYHHFEFPTAMLDAMKGDMKSDGRLVIVDWHRRPNAIFERWGINPMQHLRLDVDAVVEEITRHGWHHVETRTFLDHHFFVVFTLR
jgi:predicted methyltransferase